MGRARAGPGYKGSSAARARRGADVKAGGAARASVRAVVLALVLFAGAPLAPGVQAADRPEVTTTLSFPDAATARAEVVIRYDADTMRVESYRLPPGFVAERVKAPDRVAFDTRGDPGTGQVVEFEPGHEQGDGWVDVEIVATRRTDVQDTARRSLSVVGDGTFFFVAYAVAYEDWRAELVVRAPSKGLVWVSTADLGVEQVAAGRSWHRSRDEFVEVTVFVVADAAKADLVPERIGNYTVLAPRAWAGTDTGERLANATRAADAMWPELADIRGRGPARDGGFLVVFARDDLFAVEEGFYQAGIVAMRQRSVENGTERSTAETLVHETMHGFLDDIRWLRDEGRWLNEGVARLAEYAFEAAHPEGVVECDVNVCFNGSRRPTVREIERYEAEEGLPAWRVVVPSTAREYGEAAYVVEAFVAREGEAALRDLLRDLRTYPMPHGCDFDCVLEERIVRGHEDGDARVFFHPHAALVGTPAFANATAPFGVFERTTHAPRAVEPPGAPADPPVEDAVEPRDEANGDAPPPEEEAPAPGPEDAPGDVPVAEPVEAPPPRATPAVGALAAFAVLLVAALARR